MRKNWIWCAVVLLSMAGVTWAQTDGGTAKTIEALEQQWLKSQKENNPDLVPRCSRRSSWARAPTGK